MFFKAESTLLSTIILTGFAIVIGVAMLSYLITVTAYYRSQVDLSNHLQTEASNILVNVVSYDNTTSSLWFLFKRVDETSRSFYIVVDTGLEYLACSNILIYNPLNDNDGVLCNNAVDCITASVFYRGYMGNVYVPWEGVISDFLSYARARGYTISDTIYVCRVINICEFINPLKPCSENTLVKILMPGNAAIARVFIVTIYDNKPYIIGVYEVSLK